MDLGRGFLRGDEALHTVPPPPLRHAIEGVTPGSALDPAVARDGTHLPAERRMEVHAIRRLPGRRCSECLDVAYNAASSPADFLGGRRHRSSPRFRIEGEARPGVRFYFFAPGRCSRRFDLRCGPVGVSSRPCTFQRLPGGRRFLLEPDDLRALFSDWEIVHSREGDAAEPRPPPRCAELDRAKLREVCSSAGGLICAWFLT